MKRLVVTVIVAVFFTGCASLSLNDVYKAPQFEYIDTKISALEWSSLKGTTTVQIHNSNPYRLPVTDITIEIWLEGSPWLTLDQHSLTAIPASASVDLALDWGFVYQQILNQAKSAYDRGEAEFSVHIRPTIEVPLLGSTSLDWQESFSLPVPKLPRVSLNRWQIEDFSFTKLDMSLGFTIENPNAFSLSAEDMGFTLLREGQTISSINSPNVELGAGTSSTMTTGVSLSLLNVGKAVFDGLLAKRWPDGIDIEWRGNLYSKDLGMDLPSIKTLNVGGLN